MRLETIWARNTTLSFGREMPMPPELRAFADMEVEGPETYPHLRAADRELLYQATGLMIDTDGFPRPHTLDLEASAHAVALWGQVDLDRARGEFTGAMPSRYVRDLMARIGTDDSYTVSQKVLGRLLELLDAREDAGADVMDRIRWERAMTSGRAVL